MSSVNKIIKNCFLVVAVTIFTVLTVDLIAYAIAPKEGIGFIPNYKKNRFEERLKAAIHYFPRGYNSADPIMGFDIKKKCCSGNL